jgi:hypothetical protein
VPTGGLVLEMFFRVHAPYAARRAFTRLCVEANDRGANSLDSDDFNELVHAYVPATYAFLYHTMASRGRQFVKQLFHVTLFTNFKGMSRSGIEVLSKLKMTVSLRQFDSMRHAYIENIKDAIE